MSSMATNYSLNSMTNTGSSDIVTFGSGTTDIRPQIDTQFGNSVTFNAQPTAVTITNSTVVYFNYYQSFCQNIITDANLLVYNYSSTTNPPNVKMVDANQQRYYYQAKKLYFTYTDSQQIPGIVGSVPLMIIEHDAITNSIQMVYNKLYLVFQIRQNVKSPNDITDLLLSNNNITLNNILSADTCGYFLDSLSNSAVIVFNNPIDTKVVGNFISPAIGGNQKLLFNGDKKSFDVINAYKSLESWMQCSIVTTNDDSAISLKQTKETSSSRVATTTVTANANSVQKEQQSTDYYMRTCIIFIVLLGVIIATYIILPEIYLIALRNIIGRAICVNSDNSETDCRITNRIWGKWNFFKKNNNTIIGIIILAIFLAVFIPNVNYIASTDTANISNPALYETSKTYVIMSIGFALYTMICWTIINITRTNTVFFTETNFFSTGE